MVNQREDAARAAASVALAVKASAGASPLTAILVAVAHRRAGFERASRDRDCHPDTTAGKGLGSF